MDFVNVSEPSSSSLVRSDVSSNGTERSMASQMAEKIASGVLTCVFATVGLLIGSITGALIGLATESGLFRGAGIGAISGAVVSIDVVDSFIALWHSSDSGIWSILYVVDVLASLLSGRLVREKVGPAVQSAVQSQMNAVDSPIVDFLDIFDTDGTKGMSKDAVDKLGMIKISMENSIDSSGEIICCSVCLQDFEIEESARCLPLCKHIFHTQCIDSWLISHGSCPLCRRDI